MKILRVALSFWVIIFLLGQPVVQAQTPEMASGPTPVVTPVSNGVFLEWALSSPAISVDEAGDIEVQLPGFSYENTPGSPYLPYSSVLVALPGQGTASLEIHSISETQLDLPGSLKLAPTLPEQAAAIPSRPPSSWERIELAEIGTQRGVRLARVTLHPVLVENGKLNVASRVKVFIHFSAPAAPGSALSDPILKLIQAQVVNPTQVESSLFSAALAFDVAAFQNNSAYAIEVDQPGIMQVSYEKLKAAGFPVDSTNPLHLHLTQSGQEVAYEWNVAQNGTFNPGEALRFYADPRFSRWTRSDTYLLSAGSAPGLAIQTRDSISGTSKNAWVDVIVEDNQIYTPECQLCFIPAGHDGDYWVWEKYRWSTNLDDPERKVTGSYSFNLVNVNPGLNANLVLWLIGKTTVSANPDHQVRVYVNNQLIGSPTWDGLKFAEISLNIPAGTLVSGTNTLRLDVPEMAGVDKNDFYLDGFKVRYSPGTASNGNAIIFTGELWNNPAAYTIGLTSPNPAILYNVTDARMPVRINNFTANSNSLSFGDLQAGTAPRYAVTNTSGLRSPKSIRPLEPLATTAVSKADLIIIAPSEYHPTLTPLVELRKSQGYKVAVESLQAIYDQFNEARMDPEAIRSFLRIALTNWNAPKPAYVLLVGDGTADPKLYRPIDFKTILPPMLVDVDPYNTDIASDNRFVVGLSGPATSNLPEMAIGRLPANSIAEAQVMVNKIVNYEAHPTAGTWNSRTLFVADSYFNGIAQRAAKSVTTTIFNNPTQLFYQKNVFNPIKMHDSILNEWNNGVRLIFYTGHGAVHFWSAAGFFHITNDLPNLVNGNKLPVLLEMTCYTGTFQMPSMSSMDEQLIRKENGGVIAVWGSTSESESLAQEYISTGFIYSLAKDSTGNPTHNVGLATMAGQLNVPDAYRYIVDSFILFGDPLTRVSIDLTPKQGVIIPIIRK